MEKEQAPQFIDTIPKFFDVLVDASYPKVAGKQKSFGPLVKRGFDSALESKAAYQDFLATFEKQCSQSKLDAYVALTQTDLFRRMRQLDEAATRPGTAAEFEAYRTQVYKDRPSEARLELIRRFERAVLHTDTVMTILTSFDAACQRQFGNPPRDLGSVRTRLWQEMNLLHLFAYRTVSDEDYLLYVKLLEEPAARWFHQGYMMSLASVLQDRMTIAVRQMQREAASR
jgi:hypothetical protein